MRIFEILTLIAVTLTLIGFFFPKRKHIVTIRVYLPFITAVFIIIHLILEKYRWQMVPLYGLTLILLLISVIGLVWKAKAGEEEPTSRGRKIVTWGLPGLGLLVVLIAIFLFISFPVVQLPQPTGPYAVGSTYLQFADHARPETLTDDPNDTRTFTGRVWYPAEKPKDADPMPYQEYETSVEPIMSGGAPEFIFSHFHLSKSNSYLDAPIANDQPSYPVLVFSIGFLTLYEDYQIIAEELASHGYIVISLDTPYEWQAVTQPDGTVVSYTAEHAAAYRQHEDDIFPLWEDFWDDDTTEEEQRELVQQILAGETFMDTVLRIRVADVLFTVDELEKMNTGERESIFTGKLDLSKLGIVGHSMGGAVAGQTCLVDNRFSACVNLDGFQWGDVINAGINQPLMVIYSEPFEGGGGYIRENLTNTTYILTIENSTHMNFQDMPVVMPGTKIIGMVGSISPDRMFQITNDYLLAFFGKYLNGEDAPLLEGTPENYPEVQFEVWNP